MSLPNINPVPKLRSRPEPEALPTPGSCSACGWEGSIPGNWNHAVGSCPECDAAIFNIRVFLMQEESYLNRLEEVQKAQSAKDSANMPRPSRTTVGTLDDEQRNYDLFYREFLLKQHEGNLRRVDRTMRRVLLFLGVIALPLGYWGYNTYQHKAQEQRVARLLLPNNQETLKLQVTKCVKDFFDTPAVHEKLAQLQYEPENEESIRQELTANPGRFRMIPESLVPAPVSEEDFEKGVAQVTCRNFDEAKRRLRLFLHRNIAGEWKIDWETLRQQTSGTFEKLLAGKVEPVIYRLAIKRSHGGLDGTMLPENKFGVILYDLDCDPSSFGVEMVLSEEMTKQLGPHLSWSTPSYVTLRLDSDKGKIFIKEFICWELLGLGGTTQTEDPRPR